MKISLESTDMVTTLNGAQCRVWQGQTDSGIQIICFIAAVAVKGGEPVNQFERELQEIVAPLMENTKKLLATHLSKSKIS
jgi:hypothetical protein